VIGVPRAPLSDFYHRSLRARWRFDLLRLVVALLLIAQEEVRLLARTAD
jgi:hypothetical protein